MIVERPRRGAVGGNLIRRQSQVAAKTPRINRAFIEALVDLRAQGAWPCYSPSNLTPKRFSTASMGLATVRPLPPANSRPTGFRLFVPFPLRTTKGGIAPSPGHTVD